MAKSVSADPRNEPPFPSNSEEEPPAEIRGRSLVLLGDPLFGDRIGKTEALNRRR